MKLTRILSGFVRATTGQDLIEYALMAAFVLVAAGAIMPGVSQAMEDIFKKTECAAKGQSVQVARPGSAQRLECVARQVVR